MMETFWIHVHPYSGHETRYDSPPAKAKTLRVTVIDAEFEETMTYLVGPEGVVVRPRGEGWEEWGLNPERTSMVWRRTRR